MKHRTILSLDDELLRSERELRAEGFCWIAGVDEAGRGYIAISGGTVTVTAADDALQATQAISIYNASITTYADGDAINCDGTIYLADGCLIKK